jgi:hypothetical protein
LSSCILKCSNAPFIITNAIAMYEIVRIILVETVD